MLQIVTFLICVYLVYKGKELKMLARLRTDELRMAAIVNADMWFGVSIVIAVLFALWAVVQGASTPRPGF